MLHFLPILRQTLLPFLEEKFPAPNSHRFMQNNDPKHYSRAAQRFYEFGINWWCTPAESPDLNPIENLCPALIPYSYKVYLWHIGHTRSNHCLNVDQFPLFNPPVLFLPLKLFLHISSLPNIASRARAVVNLLNVATSDPG